ncbi:Zinc finger CCCH domain-containing protein 2 [Apostasia shenzhenica]|uniref:Zinc finger CCCH domain-containing protein 2 n=1 Tax=Apostasia shenzhenica TaxID=1088818 RepID=A0A2I0ATZ1_9ASPA|nr:Zinc finger CCCH domain-containing protein 2 [Apostasia shenzhenica]
MMMMTGEGIHRNPTVEVPPWSLLDDEDLLAGYQLPLSGIAGGSAGDYLLNEAVLAALQRYLPSNESPESDESADLADPPVDVYSCDEFRMYEFKVRRCARGRAHDWTECPYAHPGEKARRRDPRKFHYSGVACPEFRKGSCRKGDACEFAHGVFECWLHPARYRTQPCKDGTACRRRVCFFAHTPEQLRVLPQQQLSPRTPESYDGSPLRHHALDAYFSKGVISPPMSPPADSPPISPSGAGIRRAAFPVGSPVNEVLASLRKLQLSKVKSMPCSLGGLPAGSFTSLPATPTGSVATRVLDFEVGGPVERVESGRALRAKMYEKLSNDAGLDQFDAGVAAAAAPDVGWVSELVK